MSRSNIIALSCGLVMILGWTHGARSEFLTVAATADIWAAGLSNPSSLNLTAGSGTAPASYSFAAGPGKVLTFSSVLGNVSAGGSPTQYCGPTGYTVFNSVSSSTHLAAVGSISGVTSSNRGFFLVGLFTTGGIPSGPAPASPDYSSPIAFSTETPLIDQIFYVGAGTNTSGQTLSIDVPSNATTLYLGFADGADASRSYLGFNGTNGFYGDNSGSLAATFQVNSVPEPSSLVMISLGVLGLVALRRAANAKGKWRAGGRRRLAVQ